LRGAYKILLPETSLRKIEKCRAMVAKQAKEKLSGLRSLCDLRATLCRFATADILPEV